MGLTQWFQERAHVDGEPSVDRNRKDVVVPLYSYVIMLTAPWSVGYLDAVLTLENGQDRNGVLISWLAGLSTLFVFAASLVYVLCTRRIPGALCEYSVTWAAFGIVIADFGMMLRGNPSFAPLIVLIADCLLLCDCSDRSSRTVVAAGAIWTAVRGVLVVEGFHGDDCYSVPTRGSMKYIMSLAAEIAATVFVLVMDFKITRGFARSMRSQKALVEASVEVSEVAAVMLSRYDTEATRRLLEGSDAAGLPEGLRAALLQLAANLSQYRPYLPQSCLPDDGGVRRDTSDRRSSEKSGGSWRSGRSHKTETGDGPPAVSPRSQERGSGESSSEGTRNHSNHSSHSLKQECAAKGASVSLHAAAKHRNVSLVAVNSSSFMDVVSSGSTTDVTEHLAVGVDTFVCEVAACRGVVDLASGDHLFASFNASRICTTHKVSAARVAWAMTAPAGGAAPAELPVYRRTKRTACAGAGSALCGDFGTAELRRFMILGPVMSTSLCLERVAAQLGTVLVDEAVGGDADATSAYFMVLVERLQYAKRGARPFLVWQLAGQRQARSEPHEWMYELEQQEVNPHDQWNARLKEWLHFGRPLSPDVAAQRREAGTVVTAVRKQSILLEANVVGGTVAFCGPQTESSSVSLTQL
eukprot:TRINITY_DN9454_c1_g1_i1.p1 TRINITY_DN9454_c1_g1~~TRINITY_DN9454_c1_g1_i1.p1  ORF type:complete len:654 (+),score=152.01 TRINITY_DN9454_c1_g1_i1:47-1963(+)